MGIPEIVLKKGLWEAKRREEIVLPLKIKSIKPALKLFALLGYNKGKIAVRDNYIFIYKNIEFTLAKCPKGCYYYEAEFVNNKRGIKNPEKHIENILKSLGLKIWSDKEFLNFLIFLDEKIDSRFS
jgi:adenylate cyclase class IV